MKLRSAQHILLIFCFIVMMPLAIMADNSELCIKAQDSESFPGVRVNLSVDIKRGTAPFTVCFYDCKNKLVDEIKNVTHTGVCSIDVLADRSQDYTVSVKSSDGKLSSDVIRLIVKNDITAEATFDSISFTDEYYKGRNRLNDNSPVGYCRNSFLDGSYVFFSPVSSTRHYSPGVFITSSFINHTDDIGNFRSATLTGNNVTASYAVITDSAYVQSAIPDDAYTVKGFYVCNTKAILNCVHNGSLSVPAFETGDYIKITVTDIADSQTVDFYLADYRSGNNDEHYCIDSWQWVDLRTLGTIRGPLKLTFKSNLSSKFGLNENSVSPSFCIDDFDGNISSDVQPVQCVECNASIDISQFVPKDFVTETSCYSIYNVEGGYPSDASFVLDGKNLKVAAEKCNARVVVKAFEKGRAVYVTVPVVIEGTVVCSDFEQYDIVYDDSSILGNNTIFSGSYRFVNDINYVGRKGFNGIISQNALSNDGQYYSVTGRGLDNSQNYAVISNSGYVYSMIPDKEIGGFYITSTLKTYNAVTKGEGIGSPYQQGDSLMLTVMDVNSGKKVEYLIADYRSDDASRHYCIDSWQWVDLRSLGKTNAIKMFLHGNRILSDNFSPSICIDDFDGSNKILKVPAITLNADENGRATLSAGSYFHNFENNNTIRYALCNVSGLDEDSRVSMSGDVVTCNVSKPQTCNITLKAEEKGRAEYVTIPLKIKCNNTSPYHTQTNTDKISPNSGNVSAVSVNSNDDVVTDQKYDDNYDEQNKSNADIKDGGPSESNVADISSLMPRSDNSSLKDSNSAFNPSVKTADSTVTARQDTVVYEKTRKNPQEPEDMRIIYILLIVIVLAFVLMCFYIRRQREKATMEIDSLKQRYSDMLLKYDHAKDEIASLKSSSEKHSDTVSKDDVEREISVVKADFNKQIQERDAEILRLKDDVAKKTALEDELNDVKSNLGKQINEKNSEIQQLKEELSKHNMAESELNSVKADFVNKLNVKEAEIERLKKETDVNSQTTDEQQAVDELNKQLSEKNLEIEQLKNVLSSYQENVNPDVWDAEQSLLQHETVVQLHRNVDSAHVASGRQWDDLNGVVSKLMPEFFNALSDKKDILTDNEFKVCILTRINFLPTEMAVLLNLSKQRITNIRAGINQKLFNEKGTKSFESNIHNLGR